MVAVAGVVGDDAGGDSGSAGTSAAAWSDDAGGESGWAGTSAAAWSDDAGGESGWAGTSAAAWSDDAGGDSGSAGTSAAAWSDDAGGATRLGRSARRRRSLIGLVAGVVGARGRIRGERSGRRHGLGRAALIRVRGLRDGAVGSGTAPAEQAGEEAALRRDGHRDGGRPILDVVSLDRSVVGDPGRAPRFAGRCDRLRRPRRLLGGQAPGGGALVGVGHVRVAGAGLRGLASGRGGRAGVRQPRVRRLAAAAVGAEVPAAAGVSHASGAGGGSTGAGGSSRGADVALTVSVTFVPQPEGVSSTRPVARSPSQTTVVSGSTRVILISPLSSPRWRPNVAGSLSSAHSSGGDLTSVRCACVSTMLPTVSPRGSRVLPASQRSRP